jgi:apolipoprotein N-acyltransferase
MTSAPSSLHRTAIHGLLGFISGTLMGLTYQPFGTYWIASIALLPLLLGMFRATRARDGWVLMAAFYLPVTFVCAETLWQDSLVGGLFFAFGHALMYAPIGWWVVVLGKHRPVWVKSLLLTSLWVAAEGIYGRFDFWSVFASPVALGYAVADSPLTSVARLSGVTTLGLLVLAINLAVYLGCWQRSRFALVWLIVGATLVSQSSWVVPPPAQTETLRVVSIQGHISAPAKVLERFDVATAQDNLNRHRLLSRVAAQSKPDLILWPEVAFPARVSVLEERVVLQEALASLPPTLFGAVSSQDGRFGNAALYWDGHQTRDVYWKRAPVPGFESWATAGRDASLVQVQGFALGILICSDSIYSDVVRQTVAAGADALVVLANTNEGGALMHLRHSRVRAAENGRMLVQVSQRTPSALIDANGQLLQHAPSGTPSWMAGNLHASKLGTPYSRFGNWLAWAGLLVFVITISTQSVSSSSERFNMQSGASLQIISPRLIAVMVITSFLLNAFPMHVRLVLTARNTTPHLIGTQYALGWNTQPNFLLSAEAKAIGSSLAKQHGSSNHSCMAPSKEKGEYFVEWCGLTAIASDGFAPNGSVRDLIYSILRIDDRWVVPLAITDDFTYAVDPVLGYLVFPTQQLTKNHGRPTFKISI